MTSHDHDLPFLTHVMERLDEDPRADVTPGDVAAVLGLSYTAAEQVSARLLRSGLLEKRNAPARTGDGPLDTKLEVTREGVAAANSQRLD